MPKPFLSVIIPAYDEEQRIKSSLLVMSKFLEKKPYSSEIIVVDDGSTDKTAQIVKQVSVSHKHISLISHDVNQGKGAAVRTGILAAKGKFRLFSDSDLSTPIDHLDTFVSEASNADVIIGSRAIKGADIRVRQKRYRELMGQAFNLFVRLLVLPGIRDTQCGFKLFSEKAARAVFPPQRIKRWSFDVETLYLARKYGFDIKEVPVTWVNDSRSKVNAFHDSSGMLMGLISIKINDFLGRYSQKRG